jgi:hypothetical protein
MRKRLAQTALAILAFGLIETSLSTLYERSETQFLGIWRKTSYEYGFPIWWYGYSLTYLEMTITAQEPVAWTPPRVYWFSLGWLLLDVAFWFAISFFTIGLFFVVVGFSKRVKRAPNLND